MNVDIPSDIELWSAEDVIRWGVKVFRGNATVSSSFSAEDIVVIDIFVEVCKGEGFSVNCFTLDTGRLPQETYEVMDRVRDRYGIDIKVYFPDYTEVEDMVNRYGMNLFYESAEKRKMCCEVRKVRPLRRALAGFDVWVTGLRRSQSITRVNVLKAEVDVIHGGIYKLNPICDWSSEDVWNYIKVKKLPYNPLYDKGYTSIGCAPCTRSVRKVEDERAGRWWWEDEDKKECGIHVK